MASSFFFPFPYNPYYETSNFTMQILNHCQKTVDPFLLTFCADLSHFENKTSFLGEVAISAT